MNRLNEMVEGLSPIHRREFEINSFSIDENSLIVEGWLRDERFIDGFHWNGKSRPKGIVHRLCVRIMVGGWPLKVLEAEAEMFDVPHAMCPSSLESVKKLKGLFILSGFSENVRKLIGGVEGCAHVSSLILAMGPAALHGYWTHKSQKPQPLPSNAIEFPGIKNLIGSCKLWKEDGPFVTQLKEAIELANKKK
jgi:hypothetical protein